MYHLRHENIYSPGVNINKEHKGNRWSNQLPPVWPSRGPQPQPPPSASCGNTGSS